VTLGHDVSKLADRPWIPGASENLVRAVADRTSRGSADAVAAHVDELIEANRVIHERDCINLNPAANVMNPRAEAALAGGLGSRPSLGYPGAKYETGLEAVEQIEVIAAELAAEVFGAPYVEIRVASGAMANLTAFMACTQPGDPIIVPPPSIGGHVTHHGAGAAGDADGHLEGRAGRDGFRRRVLVLGLNRQGRVGEIRKQIDRQILDRQQTKGGHREGGHEHGDRAIDSKAGEHASVHRNRVPGESESAHQPVRSSVSGCSVSFMTRTLAPSESAGAPTITT